VGYHLSKANEVFRLKLLLSFRIPLARALATSDLNLDGQPDLIVERVSGTAMTLSIFGYGPNGRTDLTTVGNFRHPTEFGPVRFGNLNDDLAPDLVMMSPSLRRFSV
jgi:hypothetical protein